MFNHFRLFLSIVAILLINYASLLAQAKPDHGDSVVLGTVKVAGYDFNVTRFGEIVAGKEGAFAVTLKSDTAKDLVKLNVYLWVEDQAGAQLSAPAKGTPEGDGLHFHVTPKAGNNSPKRVTIRVRKEGLDERGSLPLDGHGHEHVKTPHDGVVAKFNKAGDSEAGYIELKLHDDKGDLEAWLGKDQRFEAPFDLPVDAELKVTFVDIAGKAVVLRARNKEKMKMRTVRVTSEMERLTILSSLVILKKMPHG